MNIDISNVKFSYRDLQRGIKVPNQLTAELAEDVGYHIGDGYMKGYRNKWSIRYEFCYSGHLIDDQDYLFNVFLPRKRNLFNLSGFRIIKKPDSNELDIRFRSKAMFTFYKEILEVQESPKKNIAAPKWISSDKQFEVAFLRGLFDSDGSMTFLKKYKKINYYPIVRFCTASKYLFEDVKNFLSDLNINYAEFECNHTDKRYPDRTFLRYDINISGVNGLNNWMETVGFSNLKHLSKLIIWKRFGYCKPYSTTSERQLIINEPGKI